MSEEPTRILFIRHATNDYVKTGRLAGRTPEVHLNGVGRTQALAVAGRLASLPIAALYSSPLERAAETALPIAQSHDISVTSLDGLAETDCGTWTGRLITDLAQSEEWRIMQSAPSRTRHPGGESALEVQWRMVSVVELLLARHVAQTIAIVSHADPIRLLLAHYIGLHVDMFQRLAVDPASISEIEFCPSKPRLLRCNDCGHLNEAEGTKEVVSGSGK